MSDVQLSPEQLIERAPQIASSLRDHNLPRLAEFVRQLGVAPEQTRRELAQAKLEIGRARWGVTA